MLINETQYNILKRNYGDYGFPTPYVFTKVYSRSIYNRFIDIMNKFVNVCKDIEKVLFDEEYKYTRKLQLFDDELIWFETYNIHFSPDELVQIYTKSNIRIIAVKNIDFVYEIITSKIHQYDFVNNNFFPEINDQEYITVFCNYEYLINNQNKIVQMLYDLIETIISVELRHDNIESFKTKFSNNTIVLNDKARITDANFVMSYYSTIFKCMQYFLDSNNVKSFSELFKLLDNPKFCLRTSTMELIWNKTKEDNSKIPASYKNCIDIVKEIYEDLSTLPLTSETEIIKSTILLS